MAFTTEEGRIELLASLAAAADQIAVAIADLGEAHELLDEQTADRLEEALFMPVQRAYGRAKRTCAEFAQRTGLPSRAFEQPVRGAPSHGAKGFVEEAREAVSSADQTLADLQDSMLPVEVGDAQLRAGLTETRELLGQFGGAARELVRTLGR